MLSLIQKIKDDVDNEEGYKPDLFVSKVKEIQKKWFKKVELILGKYYELDYNLNLDDVFVFHNPYNNYEVPMYQIYVLESQKNKYLFIKQKPIIIARIRLVGLFYKSKKPIFETTCLKSMTVFDLLKESKVQVELKEYTESSTEEFISNV